MVGCDCLWWSKSSQFGMVQAGYGSRRNSLADHVGSCNEAGQHGGSLDARVAPGQESMPSEYGRLLADGKCPTPDSRSGCLLIACRW